METNIKFTKKSERGFTLIELMVVITIMALLATAMVINFGGQRASRDIKIAQNQLVTNLRQVQSSTLSARLLPNGQSPQYYLIKFDSTKPNQYTIQAIYNVSSSPQYLADVQTVNLPPDIRLAVNNPIIITRPNNPIIQSSSATAMTCALAAYAAPFGKVFLNDGCGQHNSTTTQPYSIAANDDYAKILPSSFVSNTDCSGIYGQPFGCTTSVDSNMVITLSDINSTVFNEILVNGITGTVCPTWDGVKCLSTN